MSRQWNEPQRPGAHRIADEPPTDRFDAVRPSALAGHGHPLAALPPGPNGLGTAGFVTGLIGFVLSLIPVIGVIAWPFVLVGLGLSIAGLIRARRRGARKGLAVAGATLSAAGLVACIAYAAAFDKAVQDLQAAPTTSTTASAPTGTVPVPPPLDEPADDGTIGEGTHLVGIDVEPGRYRTAGPDPDGFAPMCYWARLADTTGGVGSINANNLGEGPQVVTIKASDEAFETRGCAAWERVDS